MKEFSLEEYLANPKRKIVTRNNMPVRIICTDKKGDKPIVALVYDEERDLELSNTYYPDGRVFRNAEDWRDLFFAPTKHEGWIFVYCDVYNDGKERTSREIYRTKQEAIDASDDVRGYRATIKIEWEE